MRAENQEAAGGGGGQEGGSVWRRGQDGGAGERQPGEGQNEREDEVERREGENE